MYKDVVYIEQLHLILEESVSQHLWGSQGKLHYEKKFTKLL